MGRKPTLTDVARASGVSPATVDRVINHRGGVNAAKEERVLRAARELGLDRRLDFTHRQIRRITVMIQPPENPFHAELRKGIDEDELIAAFRVLARASLRGTTLQQAATKLNAGFTVVVN